MEESIDGLYSQTAYAWQSIKRWEIKPDVQKQFNNNLEIADVVFVQYKSSKFSLKQIDEYLLSLGCSRTTKINLSSKILCAWNDYSRNDFYIGSAIMDKPIEIPFEVTNRHKCVRWDSVNKNIVEFFEKQRTQIGFNYSQYENLWNLYESGVIDNYRLAGIGIMTIDWSDQMFLLHMLIYEFQSKIRQSNYSQIPGWSNWANHIGISWKNHNVYAHQLMQLFKNYEITNQQIQLIYKLLNKQT